MAAKRYVPEPPCLAFSFESCGDGTFDVDVTYSQDGVAMAGFGGVMTIDELRSLHDQICALLP